MFECRYQKGPIPQCLPGNFARGCAYPPPEILPPDDFLSCLYSWVADDHQTCADVMGVSGGPKLQYLPTAAILWDYLKDKQKRQ